MSIKKRLSYYFPSFNIYIYVHDIEEINKLLNKTDESSSPKKIRSYVI